MHSFEIAACGSHGHIVLVGALPNPQLKSFDDGQTRRSLTHERQDSLSLFACAAAAPYGYTAAPYACIAAPHGYTAAPHGHTVDRVNRYSLDTIVQNLKANPDRRFTFAEQVSTYRDCPVPCDLPMAGLCPACGQHDAIMIGRPQLERGPPACDEPEDTMWPALMPTPIGFSPLLILHCSPNPFDLHVAYSWCSQHVASAYLPSDALCNRFKQPP